MSCVKTNLLFKAMLIESLLELNEAEKISH